MSRKKQDFQNILTTAQSQIHNQVRTLQRITDKDEFYQVIDPGNSTEFDILPMAPVCSRIEVKHQNIPCRLHFTYQNQGTMSVFVSTVNKEPSNANSEIRFKGRPGHIAIQGKHGTRGSKRSNSLGENQFVCGFIYITFQSSLGVKFSVTASFGSDIARKENRDLKIFQTKREKEKELREISRMSEEYENEKDKIKRKATIKPSNDPDYRIAVEKISK